MKTVWRPEPAGLPTFTIRRSLEGPYYGNAAPSNKTLNLFSQSCIFTQYMPIFYSITLVKGKWGSTPVPSGTPVEIFWIIMTIIIILGQVIKL